MFNGATVFNRDIGEWDTSKVEGMGFMFNDAISFNQDLSGWNAFSVEYCPSFATGAGALAPPNFTACSP